MNWIRWLSPLGLSLLPLPFLPGEGTACPPAQMAVGYAVPGVYAQQAVTYAAPAYAVQKQQAAVQYQVQEVIVPKAVKAYVSPDYYSSVQDYYRDKLLVDAFAGKAQELLSLQQELSTLKQQLQLQQGQQQQQGAYQQAPESQAGPRQPLRQRRPLQRAPQRQQQQGDYQEEGQAPRERAPEGEAGAPRHKTPTGLQAVVDNSCVRCHGANHEEAGAGLDLRDLDSVPLEDRLEAYAMVSSGEMPARSKPLSRDEKRLFKEWYRQALESQPQRQARR